MADLDNIQKIASIATAVSAAIGAAALGFSLMQRRVGRMQHQENYAIGIYHQYLQLAFDNPKYARPELGKIDFDKQEFDGCKEQFYKYQRFVSIVLEVCESLHKTFSKQKKTCLKQKSGEEWIRTVKKYIEIHAQYLRSEVFRETKSLELYSPEFQELVRTLANKVAK